MNALLVLLANTPSIILAVSSGVLAFNGKDGWGWFIFGAFLCTVSVKTNKKEASCSEKQWREFK